MGREEGGGFRMDFLFKLIVENKEKKKKECLTRLMILMLTMKSLENDSNVVFFNS